MKAASIQISGDGLRVPCTESHPAGILFSGGYDAASHVLYLASVMGHPRGVNLAGGDPSSAGASGLRVLVIDSGDVYWATDSMSIPRDLSQPESESVQAAIEGHFTGRRVHRVEKLGDIPK